MYKLKFSGLQLKIYPYCKINDTGLLDKASVHLDFTIDNYVVAADYSLKKKEFDVIDLRNGQTEHILLKGLAKNEYIKSFYHYKSQIKENDFYVLTNNHIFKYTDNNGIKLSGVYLISDFVFDANIDGSKINALVSDS